LTKVLCDLLDLMPRQHELSLSALLAAHIVNGASVLSSIP